MRFPRQLPLTTLAITGLALTVSATTMAQPPTGGRGPRRGPANPERLLTEMDENEDGKLTKNEVPEFAWSRLSRADKNDDGAITEDELKKARASFLSRDRDRDRDRQRPSPGGAFDREQGPPRDRPDLAGRGRQGSPPQARAGGPRWANALRGRPSVRHKFH